jgi:hypothetical protein
MEAHVASLVSVCGTLEDAMRGYQHRLRTPLDHVRSVEVVAASLHARAYEVGRGPSSELVVTLRTQDASGAVDIARVAVPPGMYTQTALAAAVSSELARCAELGLVEGPRAELCRTAPDDGYELSIPCWDASGSAVGVRAGAIADDAFAFDARWGSGCTDAVTPIELFRDARDASRAASVFCPVGGREGPTSALVRIELTGTAGPELQSVTLRFADALAGGEVVHTLFPRAGVSVAATATGAAALDLSALGIAIRPGTPARLEVGSLGLGDGGRLHADVLTRRAVLRCSRPPDAEPFPRPGQAVLLTCEDIEAHLVRHSGEACALGMFVHRDAESPPRTDFVPMTDASSFAAVIPRLDRLTFRLAGTDGGRDPPVRARNVTLNMVLRVTFSRRVFDAARHVGFINPHIKPEFVFDHDQARQLEAATFDDAVRGRHT